MKHKIIDALISGAVYVIGIGCLALVMFGLPGCATTEKVVETALNPVGVLAQSKKPSTTPQGNVTVNCKSGSTCIVSEGRMRKTTIVVPPSNKKRKPPPKKDPCWYVEKPNHGWPPCEDEEFKSDTLIPSVAIESETTETQPLPW